MTNGFSQFQTAANQSGTSAYASLQIVIPVYNDWESVSLLLPLVDVMEPAPDRHSHDPDSEAQTQCRPSAGDLHRALLSRRHVRLRAGIGDGWRW